jgi:thioredoxin-dependent peroxiredoxin
MIQEGEQAPAFTGTTGEGTRISLADFRGKPLVVFFYPKDNTTVCTKEACGFRDHAGEIAALGGAVVGVSCDTAHSHEGFAAAQHLTYPLIADTDGTISKTFGVARMGGLLGGWIPPRRVTFVIDGDGVVRRVIESEFNAGKHVDGALAALRELGRAPSASGATGG